MIGISTTDGEMKEAKNEINKSIYKEKKSSDLPSQLLPFLDPKILLLTLGLNFFLSAHAETLTELLPLKSSCQLLKNSTYYSCYQAHHRNPSWTLHELTRAQTSGQQSRSNDYRRDQRISDAVEASDYRSSGFDRGHMVPAADRRKDKASMSETFLMSNMTPQRPEFNRGIWRVLEQKIRKDFLSLRREDDVFVFTGAHLEKNLPQLTTKISIPEFFYKIIFNASDLKITSYLISNHRYSSSELESFRVSVDEIEELTGLDFFSHLPDRLELELESKI
tara:strand:+ start:4569 stop:5402 length:834 start_codon:yes stop_codon:yes gene_type:complete